MEGVKVISESVKVITETQNVVWGNIVCFAIPLLLIIALAIFVFVNHIELRQESFVVGLVAIVGLLIGYCIRDNVIETEVVVDEYPVYWVSVSDDVAFNDFDAKYEILERDGSQLLVRERDGQTISD